MRVHRIAHRLLPLLLSTGLAACGGDMDESDPQERETTQAASCGYFNQQLSKCPASQVCRGTEESPFDHYCQPRGRSFELCTWNYDCEPNHSCKASDLRCSVTLYRCFPSSPIRNEICGVWGDLSDESAAPYRERIEQYAHTIYDPDKNRWGFVQVACPAGLVCRIAADQDKQGETPSMRSGVMRCQPTGGSGSRCIISSDCSFGRCHDGLCSVW